MSMTESERYTWWDDGEAYSNYIRPAVTKRLAEYEDIGTVSEFRELKERATEKKPIPLNGNRMFKCPHCFELLTTGRRFRYCTQCGGFVDWSEGKE